MSGIFSVGDQVKLTSTNHLIEVHEFLGSGDRGSLPR